MGRLNIYIIRVCETRWANTRDVVSDKYRIIYTLGKKKLKRIRMSTILLHEEMRSRILTTISKNSCW